MKRLLLCCLFSLNAVVSHTLINYHHVKDALEENRTPAVLGFVFACSHLDAAFKSVSTHVHKNMDITVCVLMEGCHATIFIENDSGDCIVDFFSSDDRFTSKTFKKKLDHFLQCTSSKKIHINRGKEFSFSK